jgi:hypothetical protein
MKYIKLKVMKRILISLSMILALMTLNVSCDRNPNLELPEDNDTEQTTPPAEEDNEVVTPPADDNNDNGNNEEEDEDENGNENENDNDNDDTTNTVEIYGKWKPIAEWNSNGYYKDVSNSSYIEWLILNRDGIGFWDDEEFDFTFNTTESTFSFWDHQWHVFELTNDRLKMGATEDGFSEGYIWIRVEKY